MLLLFVLGIIIFYFIKKKVGKTFDGFATMFNCLSFSFTYAE